MKERILTIIVTYNRLELLKECVAAVIAQTVSTDVLIVNNCSTDNTEDYLNNITYKNVKSIKTKKNIGGAGGFSVGVKYAIKKGYKYALLMDDDTIAENNVIESYCNKAEYLNDEFSFMSCITKWTDGSLCNMNVQTLDNEWKNRYLTLEHGLIPAKTATFVSYFVNLNVAQKVGLPIKDFFIYADDWEYSLRLGKEKQGFLNVDCFVTHKMGSNLNADISTCPEERIDRCFYDLRNHLYVLRKYGTKREKIGYFFDIQYLLKQTIKGTGNKKLYRIITLLKGTAAGLTFNPKIEIV